MTTETTPTETKPPVPETKPILKTQIEIVDQLSKLILSKSTEEANKIFTDFTTKEIADAEAAGDEEKVGIFKKIYNAKWTILAWACGATVVGGGVYLIMGQIFGEVDPTDAFIEGQVEDMEAAAVIDAV